MTIQKQKPDLATLQAMLADATANKQRSGISTSVPQEENSNEVSDFDPPRTRHRTSQLSLRGKALQYLARRDHARQELRQKLLLLTENAEEVEEVDALLDDFSARGWLSDTRFAEQWTHQRGVRFGAQRLKHELRQKGVADETIAAALEEIADSEEARAQTVWQKKFGTPPANINERAKQMRFLAARGFSLDLIYKITGGSEE